MENTQEVELRERINNWLVEKTMCYFNEGRDRPWSSGGVGWVVPNPTQYQWKEYESYDSPKNHRECIAVTSPESRAKEIEWSEFGDTFNGNDDVMYIEVSHVSCSCGLFVDRTIRVEGTIGEFLQKFLSGE